MKHPSTSIKAITLMINNSVYEVSSATLKEVLKQAKEAAPCGGVYALKKENTFILVNKISNGREFRKSGFEVYRKRKNSR